MTYESKRQEESRTTHLQNSGHPRRLKTIILNKEAEFGWTSDWLDAAIKPSFYVLARHRSFPPSHPSAKRLSCMHYHNLALPSSWCLGSAVTNSKLGRISVLLIHWCSAVVLALQCIVSALHANNILDFLERGGSKSDSGTSVPASKTAVHSLPRNLNFPVETKGPIKFHLPLLHITFHVMLW